jgi:hypothetical protein
MLGDISKSEASKMLIQNYENTTAIMQDLHIADLQYFSCQKQGHQVLWQYSIRVKSFLLEALDLLPDQIFPLYMRGFSSIYMPKAYSFLSLL